jgi:hypothetical protein
MGATSSVSNRIGSAGAHGATVDQLAGYEHLFGFFGNLNRFVLSNGTDQGANDKSDDLDLLDQWHALTGPRNVAFFGDSFASGVDEASVEGALYLANTLGVDVVGGNVAASIHGQTAPVVVPNPAGAFQSGFVAYGGCDEPNRFDHIRPRPGADAGHYFTDDSGAPIDDGVAGVGSVVQSLANGVAITFPFDPQFIYSPAARAAGLPARALVLSEVLTIFAAGAAGSPVGIPELQQVALSVAPNPFNPTTVVKFTAAPGSRGSVKVFNLRGELVRTLHSGEFTSQEFRWEGTDSRGAAVSSGVYLIRATDGSTTQTKKVALVK